MTRAWWFCPRCGKCAVIPISRAVTRCPFCGATFKAVKIFTKAHTAHVIPVTRDEELNVDIVPFPIVFAVGDSKGLISTSLS